MARSLDSNIYGIDKDDLASSIASDALDTSMTDLKAIENSIRSKGTDADKGEGAEAKATHTNGPAKKSEGN